MLLVLHKEQSNNVIAIYLSKKIFINFITERHTIDMNNVFWICNEYVVCGVNKLIANTKQVGVKIEALILFYDFKFCKNNKTTQTSPVLYSSYEAFLI